jgi:hypothetical protein
MELNMRTEMTHHVHYNDLENFIAHLYGIGYSVTAAEELGNDIALSYDIDGDVPSYFEEDIKNLLAGNNASYLTRMLMNYMAREGKIPTGNYVIKVSW